MFEKQEIVQIQKDELLARVQALSVEGYRLVQICCTKLENHLQVDYTFDKEYKFLDLRLELPLENPELPSISGIYLPGFLYENELHDLFGITVHNMAIDYAGKFYRKEVDAPFCLDEAKLDAIKEETKKD